MRADWATTLRPKKLCGVSSASRHGCGATSWSATSSGRCTAITNIAVCMGERQCGFYGLDLYSLHRSMQEVISYLETVDPVAADSARKRLRLLWLFLGRR